jgi:hypothetical protein
MYIMARRAFFKLLSATLLPKSGAAFIHQQGVGSAGRFMPNASLKVVLSLCTPYSMHLPGLQLNRLNTSKARGSDLN